jgi:hypothetical protein
MDFACLLLVSIFFLFAGLPTIMVLLPYSKDGDAT